MNILKTIVLTDKILSGYGQNLKLTGLHRPTYGLIPAGLRLERAPASENLPSGTSGTSFTGQWINLCGAPENLITLVLTIDY